MTTSGVGCGQRRLRPANRANRVAATIVFHHRRVSAARPFVLKSRTVVQTSPTGASSTVL
jgi:hypothetical protein